MMFLRTGSGRAAGIRCIDLVFKAEMIMKKILTQYGIWAVALLIAAVSCAKETPGLTEEEIPDGALVCFSISSDQVETRTVYGDKDNTKKLQHIKWTPGDEIFIVMYDPSNYANHQAAYYVVEDKHWDATNEQRVNGMEQRGDTWWATVKLKEEKSTREIALDLLGLETAMNMTSAQIRSYEASLTPEQIASANAAFKESNQPLRWDKTWEKRSFVAYFIPSTQTKYQTDWLQDPKVSSSTTPQQPGGIVPQGGVTADGTSGFAMLPFHDCQPRFTLRGLGTSHIEAVPNMYYAHMYAENKNFKPTRKNASSPVYVPLEFNPFFTTFELTLTNPLDHEIGILGILFEDLQQYVGGPLLIQDITDPFNSYTVLSGLRTAGMYIYQFDHFYAAPESDPTNYVEYKTLKVPARVSPDEPGSFTFTFFCHPKTYRQMQLQIYYDIVRNPYGYPPGSLGPNQDTYAQDVLQLKNSSGQYYQFDAFKKHILTIGIPETVEDWTHAWF